MAEWFKAHAWKACGRKPSQVRILSSPPSRKMKDFKNIFVKNAPMGAVISLTVGLVLLGYLYWDLQTQYKSLNQEKISLEETLGVRDGTLSQIESEKAELQSELMGEQQKVEEFGEQVDDITETVGLLDKLSKTDPELLQKYSKIFFLNEHYVPDHLSPIQTELRWNEKQDLQIHSSISSYLEDMLSDATDDEVNIYVASAYRSFNTQSALKARHTISYGSGANRFSADQGYSEHQLGTTVDLTTVGVGAVLDGFENTSAYTWLQENAYKYGFILSYPEGNTYYIFEPWHWRFVGKDLARKLHREGKNFYDLDQREIDEHLVSIFD